MRRALCLKACLFAYLFVFVLSKYRQGLLVSVVALARNVSALWPALGLVGFPAALWVNA